jgi:hypothetical protein
MQMINAWAGAMVAMGALPRGQLSLDPASLLIGNRYPELICRGIRRLQASKSGFLPTETHGSRAPMSQQKMQCPLWTSARRAGAAVQRLAF